MKTKKEDKAAVEATATASVKAAVTDENKEPEAAIDGDKAEEGSTTDEVKATEGSTVNFDELQENLQENIEIELAENEVSFSCFKCKTGIVVESDHRPQKPVCLCGAKYRVVYRKGQLSVLAQK